MQGIENLFYSLCLFLSLCLSLSLCLCLLFPLPLCISLSLSVSASLSLCLSLCHRLSLSHSRSLSLSFFLSLIENRAKIFYHVQRYFCKLLLLKFCNFSSQRYTINRAKSLSSFFIDHSFIDSI